MIHLISGWLGSCLTSPYGEHLWEKYFWKKGGIYWCALFPATVQSSSRCKWIFMSYHTVTVERDKPHIPAFLWVLVPKGQDVRGPTATVTHHHRHWGSVSQVLQYDRDHIRTPLQYQSHHWNTLSDPCGESRNVSEKRGGCVRPWGWLLQGKPIKKIKGEGCIFSPLLV